MSNEVPYTIVVISLILCIIFSVVFKVESTGLGWVIGLLGGVFAMAVAFVEYQKRHAK